MRNSPYWSEEHDNTWTATLPDVCRAVVVREPHDGRPLYLHLPFRWYVEDAQGVVFAQGRVGGAQLAKIRAGVHAKQYADALEGA